MPFPRGGGGGPGGGGEGGGGGTGDERASFKPKPAYTRAYSDGNVLRRSRLDTEDSLSSFVQATQIRAFEILKPEIVRFSKAERSG